MLTSNPGSRIRAAATLSSRARFVGFLPWACDRTTVRRGLLMAGSVLFAVDVALDHPLRLFPVVGQELVVLFGAHQRRGADGAGQFEQPAAAVAIDVDGAGVIQQGGVEDLQGAGQGGEEVGLSL